MDDVRSTNDYGQAVRTWTLPSDVIITATTSNRRDGLDHKGAGEVKVAVHGGRLTIVSFDHTWAEGAGHELAIALANAYAQGQQAGSKAAVDRGVVCDECGAEYMDSNADHAETCSLHPANIVEREDRPVDPTIAGIREATAGNGPYTMEASEYDPYGGQKHRYYEEN